MLVILKKDATKENLSYLEGKIGDLGLKYFLLKGKENPLVSITGSSKNLNPAAIRSLPFVEELIYTDKPYKLASRDYKKKKTVVKIGDVEVGRNFTIIAGP